MCIVKRQCLRRAARRYGKVGTREDSEGHVSSWHARTTCSISTSRASTFNGTVVNGQLIDDACTSAKSDVAIYADESEIASVVPRCAESLIKNDVDTEASALRISGQGDVEKYDEKSRGTPDNDGMTEATGDTTVVTVSELRRLRTQVTRLQMRVIELEDYDNDGHSDVDITLPSYEQVLSVEE